MSHAEMIRAWKDPEYRSTLSVVPSHPAGLIELADPQLSGSAAVTDGGFTLETVRNNRNNFTHGHGNGQGTHQHCCV